jgi:hypothetical protein
MAVESSLKSGGLPFKVSGLADHMPVYYATLLWNALVARRGGEGEQGEGAR